MPWRVTPITMPPNILTPRMMSPAIASPRTNFEAPSIDPKNELSSSSSRRRCCATFSSIRPAERSASIAICLPGIASSVNLAPTSAMRVAPLVMTRKLIVTKMRKTMMPMTKSPPMTRRAKPAMMYPAAVSPLAPCARMRRVVEILSASRSTVATSSTVGNAENSSGFWIHSATIRIKTDSAIDSARPKSINSDGRGRKNRHSTSTMPTAKPISPPERGAALADRDVADKLLLRGDCA